MRTIIAVLFAWLSATAFCAEEKIAPVMPSEVTLTTGRVLRNVSVIRWESNRVVLKHAAGADPIAFTLFKIPTPEELPAIKAASIEGLKKAGEEAKIIAETKKQAEQTVAAPKKYEGQIFIVTRGAGNYKMGGVVVRVYYKPVAEVKEVFKWGSTAPKADAVGTTDAEGKFTFEGPATGAITLVAKGKRLVGSNINYDYENYLWIVSVDEMADRFVPLLSTNNREATILHSGAYESL